jgi:hypothetical protein
MTEASNQTQPDTPVSDQTPDSGPWPKGLLVTVGTILLGFGYWWFFLSWGKLTDENLQKLKPGLTQSEVHAILGKSEISIHAQDVFWNDANSKDVWENPRRQISVIYIGSGERRKLKYFDFSDK